MTETQHMPLPWKAVPNPMRDDGYFVLQDIEVEPIPGISTLKGQPIRSLPPGMGMNQTSKANAEFIVNAVNSHDDLLEACGAALRYDAAIQECANDPQKMTVYLTVQDEDLDTLYDAWIKAAKAATPA